MFFFSDDSSAEKRTLSSFPEIIDENKKLNVNFTTELDDYLSEHFSFRTDVVSVFSSLKYSVFNESLEEQVVAGKDGWLYFSKTLDDYTGKNLMSDYEIDSLVKTLDIIDEYIESKGAEFVFVVAPNKNSVYPQYMPYYFTKTQSNSNLDILNEKNKDKNYYLNIKSGLVDSKELLYHKTDTHWNNLGAIYCYNAIMKKFNKDYIDYLESGYSVKCNWQSDLNTMLFPKKELYDNQVEFNKKTDFEYISKFRSVEDLNIETTTKNGTGKLLMYRDSFTNALLPFLSSNFEYSKFTRVLPYRLNELETTDYDYVVIEIVERNLTEILKSAPILQSPYRQIDNSCSIINSAEIFFRENADLTHIYGSFKCSDIPEEIIVSVDLADETKSFVAFPIFEEKLLGEYDEEKKYFSLYIPETELNKNVKIYVK